MPTPYILFDFDGTLADSFSQTLVTYNVLAQRFHLKPAPPEMVPGLRKMGATQVMRTLGIPMWKLPRLLTAARSELQKHFDEVKPFDGIHAALASLASVGAKMAIVTSNSRENVERFLAHHRLGDFLTIDAGSSLFGKGVKLNRLIKSLGCAREHTVYVGDTIPDIRAAREAEILAVGVAWGYADRGLLESENPDALVDDPAHLARIVLDLAGADF